MKGKTWRERNPEAFNEAWRKWYRQNAERKIAWQARRREEMRAWLFELRSKRSCERCGEGAPECLQFHHLDPATKELSIAEVITSGWSKERILGEIGKCAVLCANCHCKVHWDDRLLAVNPTE